jgi:predicted nucleic-acid-binding protein
MIAFDTNHLVRYLVQDDPDQCAIVEKLVRDAIKTNHPIYLCNIVLCETVWVLESVYEASHSDLCAALKALCDEPVFEFDNPERIQKALKLYEKGKADFSDYMILQACRERKARLKTFDKKLLADIS